MERRNTVNLGISGFGKSYLTKTLTAGEPRCIITNDPKHEYDKCGFIPFADFDALVDYTMTRPVFRAAWWGDEWRFDSLFHLAFGLGEVLLVTEEADRFPCEGWYRKALTQGRDPDAGVFISTMSNAQTKGMIDLVHRSQATDVYVFNQHEPSVLDWLRVFFPPEYLDRIPQLPPKRGFHWSLNAEGRTMREIVLP